jgi:hypothetical protein
VNPEEVALVVVAFNRRGDAKLLPLADSVGNVVAGELQIAGDVIFGKSA